MEANKNHIGSESQLLLFGKKVGFLCLAAFVGVTRHHVGPYAYT
jgi:hypothetical protein